MKRMLVSSTYPEGWTEIERAEADRALQKHQRDILLQQCETPPDFWLALNTIYQFQIDVCALPHNAKCPTFHNAEFVDSLDTSAPWVQPERGILRAFCNPGFAKCAPWHRKAAAEARKDPSAIVVVVGLPGGSQDWYRFAVKEAAHIVACQDRAHYLAPWPIKQQSNPRETAFYVYAGVASRLPGATAKHVLLDWRGMLNRLDAEESE